MMVSDLLRCYVAAHVIWIDVGLKTNLTRTWGLSWVWWVDEDGDGVGCAGSGTCWVGVMSWMNWPVVCMGRSWFQSCVGNWNGLNRGQPHSKPRENWTTNNKRRNWLTNLLTTPHPIIKNINLIKLLLGVDKMGERGKGRGRCNDLEVQPICFIVQLVQLQRHPHCFRSMHRKQKR